MGLESEIEFVGNLIVLQGGEQLGHWEAEYPENNQGVPVSLTITFDDAFFLKRDIGFGPTAKIIRDAADAANNSQNFPHRCMMVTGTNFVSLAPPQHLPADASFHPENAAQVIAARVIEGVANRVIGVQPIFAAAHDKPAEIFEATAGEVAAPAGPVRRLGRAVGNFLLDRLDSGLARMMGPTLAIGLSMARPRQSSDDGPH